MNIAIQQTYLNSEPCCCTLNRMTKTSKAFYIVLSLALAAILCCSLITVINTSRIDRALRQTESSLSDAPVRDEEALPSATEGVTNPTFGDIVRSGDFLFTLNRVSAGREVFGKNGATKLDDTSRFVFVTVTVQNTAMENRTWNSQDSAFLFDNQDRMYEQSVGTARDEFSPGEDFPLTDHEAVTVALLFEIPADAVPVTVQLRSTDTDAATFTINT